MVPDDQLGDDERDEPCEVEWRAVVVAPFGRDDLVRLHALLAAYESPFTCPSEADERAADEREHERLRRYVGWLLE